MFLSIDTKEKLEKLFYGWNDFTWKELRDIIGNDAQCVEYLNDLFNNEGPYPALQQPLGPEGEIPENSVWDGMFAMLDGQPVYIGADGPCGGSGSGVGRYMLINPDSVIELM